MIILATITAAAWIWGRAIGLSKRLSSNSWKLVTAVSVTILVLSLWGLEHSSTKRQERDYRGSIVVDNSTASSEVSLVRGRANEIVTDSDLSGSCAQPYVWYAIGLSTFSQPRTLTNTPGAFSLSSPSNSQSFSSSTTALSWGQSASVNSYDLYFGTSFNPSFTVAPAIAVYNRGSSRSANQSFGLTISGSNSVQGTKVFVSSDMEQSQLTVTVPLSNAAPFNVIVMNPNGLVTRYNHLGTSVLGKTDSLVHLHYEIERRGFAPTGYTSLDGFFRSYLPPVQVLPVKAERYDNSLIFWASLLGMIVSPISTIISLVLLWISTHRRKAEALLMRLEVEKRRLEIEQLRLELENMRQQTTRPPALLIVPG
jgi:hypothetical protein